MKKSDADYPKVRDLGYSGMAEGLYRGVRGLDMPYAKKLGLNGDRAYTRNGFPEVRLGEPEPYLYGTYMTLSETPGATDRHLIATYPERAKTNRLPLYAVGATNFGLFGAQAPFVGDDYVICLMGDYADELEPTTRYWPALLKAHTAGGLHNEVEPAKDTKGHSVMLNQQPVGNDGLTYLIHAFQVHAGGWLSDAQRYSYAFTGYTTTLGPDSVHLLRTPFAFWGCTAERTLTQVPYPFYPERAHQPSFSYRVGLGKYRRLHLMSNWSDYDQDRSVPALPPYIAKSDDHGQSWSAIGATFLEPYLLHRPNDAGTGWSTLWDDDHTFNVGLYSSFHHVGANDSGQDVAFFYCSNAKVDTPGGAWDDFSYHPRLWKMVGDDFTEVLSFPPRTWRVDKVGAPIQQIPGDSTSIDGYVAVSHNEVANQILCFGNGCWMCTAWFENAVRMLYTLDFGATWTFSPELPTEVVSPWNLVSYPIVLKPLVMNGDIVQQPAQILFPGYDGGNEVGFFITDHAFTDFKFRGRVKPRKKEGNIGVGGNERYGFTVVGSQINVDFMWSYIGNKADKPPYVNPAFPGAFDQPRSP